MTQEPRGDWHLGSRMKQAEAEERKARMSERKAEGESLGDRKSRSTAAAAADIGIRLERCSTAMGL